MNYQESCKARVDGWSRRFWQGSHDHRGTADSPGRVLTLVSLSDEHCIGRVFGITHKYVEQTLKELDYREKNGYERQMLTVRTEEFGSINALTYIAPKNNAAWLGPSTDEAIADQIRRSSGPSGSNTEYVLSLNEALRNEGINDQHIQTIADLITQ